METNSKDTAAQFVRLTIEDTPGVKRPWAIREHFRETMQVEIDPIDPDRPFQYKFEGKILSGIGVGSAQSSRSVVHRTKELVKEAQDDLVLVMPETRMTVSLPNGDDMVIDPGSAVILSQLRERRVVYHDDGATWTARLQHGDMLHMLPRLGSAPVMEIRQGSPMLSLLSNYRRFVLDADPLAHPDELTFVSRHMKEIIAGAISRSEAYVREAEENTLAAVRLRVIKGYIEANLGEPHLDLLHVAAKHGLSARHVQRMFASEGTIFSDYLRHARVSRVYAMLEDPRNAGRTISSIANECGFAEASTMNRAFKDQYGMKPGDMRWRG